MNWNNNTLDCEFVLESPLFGKRWVGSLYIYIFRQLFKLSGARTKTLDCVASLQNGTQTGTWTVNLTFKCVTWTVNLTFKCVTWNWTFLISVEELFDEHWNWMNWVKKKKKKKKKKLWTIPLYIFGYMLVDIDWVYITLSAFWCLKELLLCIVFFYFLFNFFFFPWPCFLLYVPRPSLPH